MVGKKQRFRTAILVLILAVAIVGGVFAISYFKGGVTFPWQIATAEQEQEQAVTEPAKEEPKLVVKEKQEAEEKKEEPKEEQKEEPKEEEKTEDEAVVQTGRQLDYYGSLHVEDGKLYDEVRNEVRLTGISTNNLSWYPDFASADSIKFLKSNLGINVIRLALFTSDYDGYCVAGADKQQELKKIIDEAVQAATDNEMYVILDWHTLNDANPNEYKSEAIQFFGEMVRKYESNENVIYEICKNQKQLKRANSHRPLDVIMVRWMRIELTPCYRLAPETSASTVPPPAHGDKYTINPLKSRISLA